MVCVVDFTKKASPLPPPTPVSDPKAMMASHLVETGFHVYFDVHSKLKARFCSVPLMLQHSNFDFSKSRIYRTYLNKK